MNQANRPRHATPRYRWLIGLVVLALVLIIVLAWQAHSAATSHLRAAENVIKDYAGLAADEFIRRSLNEVGYYGYFVLADWLKSQNAPLQELRASAAQDPKTR
ncbi:MAG: hypothetical protein AAF438_13100, partial [Pseudomonadota bacterium]